MYLLPKLKNAIWAPFCDHKRAKRSILIFLWLFFKCHWIKHIMILDSKGTIVPFFSRLCFAELLLLWVLCYTGTHGHQQLHLMHNFVPICIYNSVGVSLFVFSTFISFFQKHTYLQCKVLRYGMLRTDSVNY